MIRTGPRGALGALVAAWALTTAVAGCGAIPAEITPPAPAGREPTAIPTGARSPEKASAAVAVTAENVAFAPAALEGPAGVPLTITLSNRDDGVPHNIVIRAGPPENDVAPVGPDLFSGEVFTGRGTRTYAVPALPAGVYTFSCAVHPNMVGTLTLR